MIKDYFLNYEAMNNDFTICLGRKAKIDYHGVHDEQDFRVTLADTGLDTMTGGRDQSRRRNTSTAITFMVTYGDGLSDVDVRKLVDFHRSHGKLATVTAVRPSSRFGVLERRRKRSRSRVRRKAAARRLGQRRLLRLRSRASSTTSTATTASSSASRWSAWRPRASWWRTGTTASSSRWTPIANTRC